MGQDTYRNEGLRPDIEGDGTFHRQTERLDTYLRELGLCLVENRWTDALSSENC